MFLGSKVRLVHRADNFTAIYEPIVCAFLNISQPNRPPRPVTGIALLFTFTLDYRGSNLFFYKIPNINLIFIVVI
jgi:hypothetical protein